MSLQEALDVVKRAGFRVSKPKKSRKKDRVGPTFVTRFADGQVTRMSCYCESDEKLDWERGERLSIAAYESRTRHIGGFTPAIADSWFERDGVQL